MEIHSQAKVPFEKIVIGKPLLASDGPSGHMDPATFSSCMKQAKAKESKIGVMFWQWHKEAAQTLATVLG